MLLKSVIFDYFIKKKFWNMMKNYKFGYNLSFMKLWRCFYIWLRVWCILGRN